jgi:hypothetical protein
MTMEDEMIKDLAHDTHVYVDDCNRPLSVGMYTDEHSEVCSIRFGSSFTLNVVTPQDLLALAMELDKFAKRAHELHYAEGVYAHENSSWSQIQKKLEDAGIVGLDLPYDPEDTVARTMAEETKSQEEIMMKGTSSSCVWKDPSDPINW